METTDEFVDEEENGSLLNILNDKKKIFLAVVLILMLIAASYFLFFSVPKVKKTNVIISVSDTQGKPIENAEVKIIEADLLGNTNNRGNLKFELELGKKYTIKISKQNYEEQTNSFIVDEENKRLDYYLATKYTISPTPQTISFADTSGRTLSGKNIRVELSCSNNSVSFSTRELTTNTGQITFTPPVGCGAIQLNVRADGYKEKSVVVNGSDVIKLDSIESPKGGLAVYLNNLEQLPNVKLILYDSIGIKINETYFIGNSATLTNLPIGRYYAIVVDESGNYGATKIENIEIKEKQNTEKYVTLYKEIKINLNIRILEKDSLTTIDEAEVFLLKDGRSYYSDKTKDGIVKFWLYEDGNYQIKTYKEGYIGEAIKTINTMDYNKGQEVNIDLYLEECTPVNCGSLAIRVIDEDNLPVAGARVNLFDANTMFLLEEYGTKYTDLNGFTQKYINLKKSRYYAFVYKYPSSAKSEVFEIDTTKENFIEVKLKIGTGSISFLAIDADNKEVVPFADVKIYSESDGKEIGKIKLDEKGGAVYNTKADKRIYAVFKAPEYIDYYTNSKQIMPNEFIEFIAEMSKEILDDKPKIEFIKILTENKNEVSQIGAGGEYYIKFLLYLPTNYPEAGVFFRVGDQENISKDKIYIEEINFPNSWQKRGISYTPPKGQTNDLANITTGKAKWALLSLKNAKKGVYEIEIKIKVNKDTPKGFDLPIYYRAYAKSGLGILRDPSDEILGYSEENAEKQGLYAASYELRMYESAEDNCYLDFCFGTRLLDLNYDIYLNEPYTIRNLTDYNLEFSITNKKDDYQNSQMRINNSEDGVNVVENISIEKYYITNASAVTFSSDKQTFETEPINLGEFKKNKKVSGSLVIKSISNRPSSLYFNIFANREKVFSRNVSFITSVAGDLNIIMKPEILPAFLPIELEILVVEKSKNMPIEDATVKVTIKEPKKDTQIFIEKTNKDGIAKIKIPSMLPKTKIILEAEKPNFTKATIEREINENIVGFEPESLDYELNLSDKREETKKITIKNLINSDLKIRKIYFGGQTYGILDEAKINNWLRNFAGITIPAQGSIDIEVLIGITNEVYLAEPLTINGKIFLELESALQDTNAIFKVSAPAKVTINLMEPPSEEGCLQVNLKEWNTVVLTGKTTTEFYIINNCKTKNGNQMDLKNLQANLEWGGEEKLGNVELSIKDLEEGEVSEILPPSTPVIFFERVPATRQYLATLSFVPDPNTTGKTAKFNIKIFAEIPVAEGKQVVNGSNEISANILITELGKCIKFNPEPDTGITIKKDQQEAFFEMDSSACGNIPIDVWLCKDDDGCKGGASEGSIDVKPTKFTLEGGSKKQIKVRRMSIPGMYGITVYLRTAGNNYYKIVTYDVTVEPDQNYAFELDKYEFFIKGKGTKDSATITNNMLSETITVDASICDWGDEKRKKDNWFNLPAAGIGASAGALLAVFKSGAKDGATQAASQLAAANSQKLKQLKQYQEQLSKQIKQVKNSIENTKRTINNARKAVQDAHKQVQEIADKAATLAPCGSAQATCATCAQVGAQAGVEVTAFTNAYKDVFKVNVQDIVKNNIDAPMSSTYNVVDNTTPVVNEINNIAETPPDVPDVSEGASLVGCGSLANKIGNNLQKAKNSLNSLKNATQQIKNSATQVQNELTKAKSALEAENAARENVTSAGEANILRLASQARGLATNPALSAQCNACATQLTNCQMSIRTTGEAANVKTQALIAQEIQQADQINQTITDATNNLDTAALDLDSYGQSLQEYGTQLSDSCNQMQDIYSLATNTAGKGFSPILVVAPLAGFVGGGLLGGLFDKKNEDKCKQRYSSQLMDYVINMAEGFNIISDIRYKQIKAELSKNTMRVYGEHEKQQAGIIFTNDGIEESEPVYTTVSFVAIKHTHDNPTRIGQGEFSYVGFNKFSITQINTNYLGSILPFVNLTPHEGFGAFNVPDRITDYGYTEKFHLKFITAENKEQMPLIDQDPVNCVLGGKRGITGEFAKPKVNFNWSWKQDEGISWNACDADNPNYIYCDAVQFTISLAKRLQMLNEFFKQNDYLGCPQNKYENKLAEVMSDFNNFRIEDYKTSECWIDEGQGLIEGVPALIYYIRLLKEEGKTIKWTKDIPNEEALMKVIYFDAYLIEDGYTKDMVNDFVKYYTNISFFDTPVYFKQELKNIFVEDKIKFKQFYYDDEKIPASGLYKVFINVDFNSKVWKLIDSQGKPLADITTYFYFQRPPENDNVFYHIPLDGMVGIEGDNLDRQGYGVSYTILPDDFVYLNLENKIRIMNSGNSNGVINMEVKYERSPYYLNTSLTSRGNLLTIERINNQRTILKFAPSFATPVLQKISKKNIKESPFSAYYTVNSNNTPINTGSSFTYWTGVGNCLDFRGMPVYKAFNESPDRIATNRDVVSLNQTAYAIDWPLATYTGDVYLRTIIFTNPKNISGISAINSQEIFSVFMTPDETGTAVKLLGISSMPNNNQNSRIDEIADILYLLEKEYVCMSTSERKTILYWNPKALYEASGVNGNIQKIYEGLNAGVNCIGY